MNYLEFVSAVREEVCKYGGPDISVCIRKVNKNNGKERMGLMIEKAGANISPTIYLEEYYEWYKTGACLEEIGKKIWNVYREVRVEGVWDSRKVIGLANVKDKIVYRVINREKNRKLLEYTPYFPYLDLAVVCYVLFEKGRHGSVIMPVQEEHLKLWGITKEELFSLAHENTKILLQAEVMPMRSAIMELFHVQMDQEKEDILYVLTNEMRSFGAACILYEGVLMMIGDMLGEDYYVLPSSIHEVLILPKRYSTDRESLEAMVKEINETQLDEEEVLSDHVYFYSRKRKKLIL